jgi:hypothetical protein
MNGGNLICAVRWPITLMTVGALFALNNFTEYKFYQTWPMVLIVFGLLSLACRGVERTAPRPAAPPPGPHPGPPWIQPPPGSREAAEYQRNLAGDIQRDAYRQSGYADAANRSPEPGDAK